MMSVSRLLAMPSAEARRGGKKIVSDLWDEKAGDLIKYQEFFILLDPHLINGNIDPIILSSDGSEVIDGTHRIVRAHQLGVSSLPISCNPDDQVHLDEWDIVLGIKGSKLEMMMMYGIERVVGDD